ncbi:MAG: acylneuraminate cytidylyltransferase family protein, partial [Nitrospirota bacterium]
MTKKNILAVIPARGGSKGLPWKNIMLLNGKPLIYYMITAAKACRFIDKLLLSTDDERIAGIGKEYGIDVPFTRPAELAQDDTPIIPVLKHAMDYLDSSGWKADLVLSLQPTNPLTTADIIGSVIKKHLETDCDSVVTVTIIKHGHPYRAKRIVEGDRLVNFVTEVDGDKFICRQERPPAYAY